MHDLLTILADGEVHSGAEIGDRLGITRAAVWKRIQKLARQGGLGVVSIPGQGYRLTHPLELLDQKVLSDISGSDTRVLLLQSVDSTNAYAKRLLKEGNKVDVVIAEEQTGGVGRRGRDWQSPYGCNLYASFVWPVTEGVRQLEGLSLAVGLAVLRAIEDEGVDGGGLKWPNDVLVEEAKISGVLLELVGDLADQSHVIIGIGLNVNMQQLVSAPERPWTSLCLELGRPVSRHGLYRKLLFRLHEVLAALKATGFSGLQGQWEARHLWRGEQVELSTGTHITHGRVAGINERGELGLETGGGVHYFAGGEISVRLASDS